AWHYLRAPCRLARPALLALLLAALGLDRPGPAHANYFPPDRVEEFKQALKVDPDPIRSKEALDFRRKNLAEKGARLTSVGALSRAVPLQDWRTDPPGKEGPPPVYEIDTKVRQELTERFEKGIREALNGDAPAGRAAAAALLAETAASARNVGPKTLYLRG